jgi:hypothetical protein
MKAILCSGCLDIRALEPTGKPTTCRCGNITAWWVSPAAGTVKVSAIDRSKAFILGMNNTFLTGAIEGFSTEHIKAVGGKWAAMRKLHDQATNAPGYVFGPEFCNCWACIFKVGETGDVTWDEKPKVEPV